MFDGLCTTKVIGGKAAAFGGNGTERIGYNRPDDKIKAGCTVKFKTLEEEIITPAHTVQFNGVSYAIPEKVERKYKDKLMTVSHSGIGCEMCRTLAEMSDRGYVDVSTIVLSMDPADAPVQQDTVVRGGTKQKMLRGVTTLGKDNILRVKDCTPVEEFVAPKEDKQETVTVKVSKPVDPLAIYRKQLASVQDSLLYWTSNKRVVRNGQSLEFIADQAYKAARETAHLHREITRKSGQPQYVEGL